MRPLYCIICPAGCLLNVLEFSSEDIEVQGNGCERGVEFAKSEISNPMRSLTTTVRTTFPGIPALPVRTDGEIPKGKIMEAMNALSQIIVSTELDCGDTVAEDIADCGVNVIATSDMLSAERRGADISKANSSIFKNYMVTNPPDDMLSYDTDDELFDDEDVVDSNLNPDSPDSTSEQDAQSGRARIRQ